MNIVDPDTLRSSATERGEKAPSLSEQAYRLLRHQILRREIPPGERLRMEVLQREYSFSSSPLREALNRLVVEGLVTADDHRGFRAAEMSAEDLHDITAFRLVNEPAALAQSIARGDDAWAGHVISTHHQLEKIEEKIAREEAHWNEEWTARHKNFHMALVSAADSVRLVTICSSLFDQAERYRRFSARNRVNPRDTKDEHRRLMEAAVGRQGELAVALLKEHLQRTTRNVIDLGGYQSMSAE
ncbi:FCD domain-containing protein [Roseiarcaceae bacterium H3SJ34-1]|uniref:GntR family transcriptional regulator n=1 Tax=Terripilifer ovatus TaxID=3032367 RepID=UPI003AB95CD9|nr:FCD domain-containing protein [Roseiarcaceae bacterium H3SJ34-1]